MIHERKLNRLGGYDYATDAAYFITICVKDHQCRLGHVTNGIMELNANGIIVEQWTIYQIIIKIVF